MMAAAIGNNQPRPLAGFKLMNRRGTRNYVISSQGIARMPAQAARSDEFERGEWFLKADGHWSTRKGAAKFEGRRRMLIGSAGRCRHHSVTAKRIAWRECATAPLPGIEAVRSKQGAAGLDPGDYAKCHGRRPEIVEMTGTVRTIVLAQQIRIETLEDFYAIADRGLRALDHGCRDAHHPGFSRDIPNSGKTRRPRRSQRP